MRAATLSLAAVLSLSACGFSSGITGPGPGGFTGSYTGNVTFTGDLVVTGGTTTDGPLLPEGDLTDVIGSGTATWANAYIKSLTDQSDNTRITFDVFDGTVLNGNAVNDGATFALKVGNSSSISTLGAAGIVGFYNDAESTLKARIAHNGFYLQPLQTVTVNDNGGGTAPASTVTPTSSEVALAYNDSDGSSVGTLTESGAQEGNIAYILHTGSGGTVDFAASAGVFVTKATCTLVSGDMLIVKYRNSAWQNIGCIDNTP